LLIKKTQLFIKKYLLVVKSFIHLTCDFYNTVIYITLFHYCCLWGQFTIISRMVFKNRNS
jgi:hypothetical protein